VTSEADSKRLGWARHCLEYADHLERRAEELREQARLYRAGAVKITTPHERDRIAQIAALTAGQRGET
jgi:hypothetical protein